MTEVSLAALVAAMPGVAQRLLADHVDDGTGHCRRCPVGAQAGYQRWPCTLHDVGRSAVLLSPVPDESVRRRHHSDDRDPRDPTAYG